MAPRRNTVIRRPRIPDDVLLSILELLDPPSLWRACRAFQRIYLLTMSYQHLRYKYELAVSGMNDGPVAYTKVSPMSRLKTLLTYRRDWLELIWKYENRLQIPMPAQAGSSGGFVYQIHSHGPLNSTLQLSELPSDRKCKPPDLTRHQKLVTSVIDHVVVDISQNLVVTGRLSSNQSRVTVQLDFRVLWTFVKHPRARGLTYELSIPSSADAANVRMTLRMCGSKLSISLLLPDGKHGKTKHSILNWLTFDASWLDDEDILFLDETYLLGASSISGSAILRLYNVAKIAAISVVREFELPPTWFDTILRFVQNTAPRSDISRPSDAIFYTAPETRVLAISSTPTASSVSHTGYYPMSWLFLKESYFKFPSRKDGFRVPWRQWGQYCLIKEIGVPPGAISGPCVVGMKVLYVENLVTRSSRSDVPKTYQTRLRVIDFSPFAEPDEPPRGYMSVGPRANLVPVESSRTIPSYAVDGLPVKRFDATEDNIVLFLEPPSHRAHFAINVLTFGGLEVNRPSN
ncbi:hypothetical protein FB446DRAFT_186240 [Lentinula raphanica]|uniref:F-box domain-containing protein n=1 Tax=Lentinula raphanica TaxID=153919 RepID=A0AA38PK54_9AGAR|nr:hypothetical protein FB446DRAFT_186240 [Lentinula raphanica]KAJ3844434.1 hypothetical protein F5878DRAFT_116517 [Lentinula raphanica]